MKTKEKEQPIYKWAQGKEPIELLEKEGGVNLYGLKGISNDDIYYMPFVGGLIECECGNEALGYIKSHGIEVLPKEILDNAEKKYLGDFIRPWRDKVKFIYKDATYNTKEEWLTITLKDDVDVMLPSFSNGKMYKGMELEKNYSLEELGL